MIKKIALLFAAIAISNLSFSQEVITIKAGTIIPVMSVKTVKAAEVNEGTAIPFTVTDDVIISGKKIIERGSIVKGVVREAKKSTIAGTKGCLVIDLTRMSLSNGETLFFSDSSVRIYGKNRTPVAVVAGLFFLPCICICGSKAEMPSGYETTAMVANSTEVQLNNQ